MKNHFHSGICGLLLVLLSGFSCKEKVDYSQYPKLEDVINFDLKTQEQWFDWYTSHGGVFKSDDYNFPRDLGFGWSEYLKIIQPLYKHDTITGQVEDLVFPVQFNDSCIAIHTNFNAWYELEKTGDVIDTNFFLIYHGDECSPYREGIRGFKYSSINYKAINTWFRTHPYANELNDSKTRITEELLAKLDTYSNEVKLENQMLQRDISANLNNSLRHRDIKICFDKDEIIQGYYKSGEYYKIINMGGFNDIDDFRNFIYEVTTYVEEESE